MLRISGLKSGQPEFKPVLFLDPLPRSLLPTLLTETYSRVTPLKMSKCFSGAVQVPQSQMGSAWVLSLFLLLGSVSDLYVPHVRGQQEVLYPGEQPGYPIASAGLHGISS